MDTKYMLPVGTLLNGGRYKIVEHLSSGGFGKTYVVEKVFHKGELYALKEFFIKGINARHENTVIVSNDENEETFNHQKEKFLTEAERLRDVENEHIVRVHDFFSDNGTCYYVMDLIDGESLNTVKKPLKEEKVWDILNQSLDALSTIHQKKTIENKKERIWVHLDIKPANLMVDKNGKITLIDFGASKQLSAKDSNSSISMSQISFTKGYAPIEQTSQRVDSIGPWTDFYALGATLYKLITEKDSDIPEYSELNDLLYANEDITQAFSFPKNVSEKMRKLIVWMMNPDRKKRPQSVEEVRAFMDGSYDEGEKNKPEEESEVTVIGNLENEKRNVLFIKRIINIFKRKESYMHNKTKKKIIVYIFILLVIAASTLCYIYLYIPYYNKLQIEYKERMKVLQDIERVDSVVHNNIQYHYYILDQDVILYSKLGVAYGQQFSDSLVVLNFAEKSFYDNYNPFEWRWAYCMSSSLPWPQDIHLVSYSIFSGWWFGVRHELVRRDKVTKRDSVRIHENYIDQGFKRPDIKEIYKSGGVSAGKTHYLENYSYSMVLKPFEKIDEYCGGTYIGPLVNGKLGGKNAMFFLKNGDVFVGEFKDNYFYRGKYLYRYGHDNGDDNSYYFVGTFSCNTPYRGRWYNKKGKRLH